MRKQLILQVTNFTSNFTVILSSPPPSLLLLILCCFFMTLTFTRKNTVNYGEQKHDYASLCIPVILLHRDERKQWKRTTICSTFKNHATKFNLICATLHKSNYWLIKTAENTQSKFNIASIISNLKRINFTKYTY